MERFTKGSAADLDRRCALPYPRTVTAFLDRFLLPIVVGAIALMLMLGLWRQKQAYRATLRDEDEA